jgi:hypothetical protein
MADISHDQAQPTEAEAEAVEANRCIICFNTVDKPYISSIRPASCVCNYTIHKDCHDTWLHETLTAYNCVLCRTRIDMVMPVVRQEPQHPQHPQAQVITIVFDRNINVRLLCIIAIIYILILNIISSLD